MLQSFGYLNYDPKNILTRYEDWWLILRCDEGLTAYYRKWVEREYPIKVDSQDWLKKAELDENQSSWLITQHGVKINKSVWGSHVSVIRGEVPRNKSVWSKYQNKKIMFEYDPAYLNTNGKHWWFRIFSPQLEQIRKELGLTSQPRSFNSNGKSYLNPFHITIGSRAE